jgi:glyoxalase family protein
MDRLRDQKIKFDGPIKRFEDSEEVITLHDTDGIEVELVAHESAKDRGVNVWKGGSIPVEHAIRGFYSVTLSEEGYERTSSILTDELGFIHTREEGSRFRYEIPTSSSSAASGQGEVIGGARIVDVLCLPYAREAVIGTGSVHHVAWRTPSDEQQKIMRHKIVRSGLNATPVIIDLLILYIFVSQEGALRNHESTRFTVDERKEELGLTFCFHRGLNHKNDLRRCYPN